ncbi:UNVERIFIED_CONTAM: hypothetical protein PYX00_008825 [Menopon gallinae]|uniref:Gag protein n=1 Tax=Menopon gallinae TaxID=328185 RepID=A0AAW2HR45_9NEOP
MQAKECGLSQEAAAALIKTQLWDSLPRSIVILLRSEEDQTVENLLTVLCKRAKIERQIARDRPRTQQAPRGRSASNAGEGSNKCTLCSKFGHGMNNCRTNTPEFRRNQAIKLGLCLKCLRRGHKSNVVHCKAAVFDVQGESSCDILRQTSYGEQLIGHSGGGRK